MSKTPEELTWDWKAGKLEYGRYWVKNKVWEKPFIDRWRPNCSWEKPFIDRWRPNCSWEKPFIDRWRPNCSWEISCKDAIEQILAPVPTYDEYKAMQEQIADACKKIEELKKMLKECYKKTDEALQEIQKDCEADEWTIYHYAKVQEFYNFSTRINAALGDMLKNPENFNTPDENVKGDDR